MISDDKAQYHTFRVKNPPISASEMADHNYVKLVDSTPDKCVLGPSFGPPSPTRAPIT